MRLDLPRLRDRFGAVLFYGLQSVYELDAGMNAEDQASQSDAALQRIPHEQLRDMLSRMAIVIPVKDEKLKLLDNLLAGIPHATQIIVVSNSSRSPVDRFRLEHDLVRTFGVYTHRPVITVHQRDPHLARAFADSGYPHLLDQDGLIRNGKAEGMMLGTMLAHQLGKQSIGFIDSDNYFPGAVLEYCYIYAAGFALSREKTYTMVRIAWHSKPKIVESALYFAKWGRSSVVTNDFMNQLVSQYTGFETEAIRTGNAGEHAMTLDLALILGWSSGYSIEPYQLIYLMEQYGGVSDVIPRDLLNKHLHVYQIESRNPHLHESKGEDHVDRMIEASLSVIYHSSLCTPQLKHNIEQALDQRKIRTQGDPIPALPQYPPLISLDMARFRAILGDHDELKGKL